MSKYDIYLALGWLSWRLHVHSRKYPSHYLDGMALQKLREISAAPAATEAVKTQAQEAVDRFETAEPGDTDRACNVLCKHILREAKEADFIEMLTSFPKKIPAWRTLWNDIRANKIRRI